MILQPHNIGLMEDDTVRLFDFGFCRQLPSQTDEEQQCTPQHQHQHSTFSTTEKPTDSDEEIVYFMSGKGTLLYMAPEVLSVRRFNQKADVYSWAMVFYEMLTLSRPYPNRTIDEHRRALVKRKERPKLYDANIPYPVQHLLQRCWDGDVRQRFRMKDACNHLENIVTDHERGSFLEEGGSMLFSKVQDLLNSFIVDVQVGYENIVNADNCKENNNSNDIASTLILDSAAVRQSQQMTESRAEHTDASRLPSKEAPQTGEDTILKQRPVNKMQVRQEKPAPSQSPPFANNGKLIYHKFYGPIGTATLNDWVVV
jgi:serine/threonine protein kinase